MSSAPPLPAPVQVDGRPASPEQLAHLAFHNYGHYTFFQVRDGAVRGLELHLSRLRSNALEVFGRSPDRDQLVAWVRAAVADRSDCSVRLVLFSEDLDGVNNGAAVLPAVCVSVSGPRPATGPQLRVRTVSYTRETPGVKHRATHGLTRLLREARQAGYDDALFVDDTGAVTEGTTWNLLLHDGDGWVWPQGSMLDGVTMQLLRAQMGLRQVSCSSRPVTRAEVTSMRAAFALNASSADRPVIAIDDQPLGSDPRLRSELQQLWSLVEAEAL